MAKPAKNVDVTKADAPWWLEPGEEDCPHCEHAYSYHVEARCFECDAPVCPMCIVHVEGRVVCPACRVSAETK